MEAKAFELLSESEQKNAIFYHGKYLAKLEYEEFYVALYYCKELYVEVVYCPTTFATICICASRELLNIDLYLDRIALVI